MADHTIDLHKHAAEAVADNAAALHNLNTRFNDLEQEISKQLQNTLADLELLEGRAKTSYESALAGYKYLEDELSTLTNTMKNAMLKLTSVSQCGNRTTLEAKICLVIEP